MSQTIDDLRDHYLETIPGIGAHEAHIRACRDFAADGLDEPIDVRIKALPTVKPGEAKAKK